MNAQNSRVLVPGFALVAVVLTTLVVMVAGGGMMEIAYALGAGAGVGVVVVGSYTISSKKGLPNSHSVAIAGIALGVLVIIAISARLLTKFGA
ncbi:hypothetical protein ACFQJ7_15080 [Halovenus rubra]|uniref:Uncharacterized protein n=2 Tax=Halovenus rubra TaxID=869890 RepID=A0ACC7DZ16_9EURY|nr:hypothetical protein [Halovenus rubra]